MKRYGVLIPCMLLCAIFCIGGIVKATAQSDEAQINDATNIFEEYGTSMYDELDTGSNEDTPLSNEPDVSETYEDLEGLPPTTAPSGEEVSAQEDNDAGEYESAPLEEEAELQEESVPDEEGSGTRPVQETPEENPEIATAMAIVQTSMSTHISDIKNLLGASGDYTLIAGNDNLEDALAVYAIRHEQTENYPYDVMISSSDNYSELLSIYWSLNSVHASKNESGTVICITRISPVDAGILTLSEIDTFYALINIEIV